MKNAKIEKEVQRINKRMLEVKQLLHCEDMQWEVKYDNHRNAFYEYVCGKEFFMSDVSYANFLTTIESVITSIEILMYERYRADE